MDLVLLPTVISQKGYIFFWNVPASWIVRVTFCDHLCPRSSQWPPLCVQVFHPGQRHSPSSPCCHVPSSFHGICLFSFNQQGLHCTTIALFFYWVCMCVRACGHACLFFTLHFEHYLMWWWLFGSAAQLHECFRTLHLIFTQWYISYILEKQLWDIFLWLDIFLVKNIDLSLHFMEVLLTACLNSVNESTCLYVY